ncbi:MAG: ubiquitin-like domain-containing protein [Actinomycetaceae bacterium]|nr:ubiquitin-like domain-containing protein [Actinomycetaceae bacterium]
MEYPRVYAHGAPKRRGLSRRLIIGTATASVLALLGTAAIVVGTARADVTIEVDGVSVPVTAWNPTPASVLEQMNIEVGEHDLVEPALDTRLAAGEVVVVRRAHPFTVAVDGERTTVWSTEESAQAVLANVKGLDGDAVLVADRSSQRPTPTALVAAPTAVNIKVGDKVTPFQAQPGKDAREILSDAKIPVDALDRVQVSHTKDALTVEVIPVDRGTVTRTDPVKTETVEKKSDELFVGEVVVTKAKDGTNEITLWQESVGGKAIHSVDLSNKLLSQPVAEVRTIGTKEVNPGALIEAGIDPKAELEEKAEDDQTTATRFRSELGSLSSDKEIRDILGANPTDKQKAAVQAAGINLTENRPQTTTTNNQGDQPAENPGANTATPPAPENNTPPQGSYSGDDPKGIAQQMVAARGWSDSEFQCLVKLWERESNWNPYAENPSSGAYGIPQSLPGSKMASAGSDWQTNPATQITWGLGYIAGRYGTPCGALGHSDSVGWY